MAADGEARALDDTMLDRMINEPGEPVRLANGRYAVGPAPMARAMYVTVADEGMADFNEHHDLPNEMPPDEVSTLTSATNLRNRLEKEYPDRLFSFEFPSAADDAATNRDGEAQVDGMRSVAERSDESQGDGDESEQHGSTAEDVEDDQEDDQEDDVQSPGVVSGLSRRSPSASRASWGGDASPRTPNQEKAPLSSPQVSVVSSVSSKRRPRYRRESDASTVSRRTAASGRTLASSARQPSFPADASHVDKMDELEKAFAAEKGEARVLPSQPPSASPTSHRGAVTKRSGRHRHRPSRGRSPSQATTATRPSSLSLSRSPSPHHRRSLRCESPSDRRPRRRHPRRRGHHDTRRRRRRRRSSPSVSDRSEGSDGATSDSDSDSDGLQTAVPTRRSRRAVFKARMLSELEQMLPKREFKRLDLDARAPLKTVTTAFYQKTSTRRRERTIENGRSAILTVYRVIYGLNRFVGKAQLNGLIAAIDRRLATDKYKDMLYEIGLRWDRMGFSQVYGIPITLLVELAFVPLLIHDGNVSHNTSSAPAGNNSAASGGDPPTSFDGADGNSGGESPSSPVPPPPRPPANPVRDLLGGIFSMFGGSGGEGGGSMMNVIQTVAEAFGGGGNPTENGGGGSVTSPSAGGEPPAVEFGGASIPGASMDVGSLF